MSRRFSFARCAAILIKEFIQMRRDQLTFGMLVGIPVIQLLLFGFAINLDPKHLPTALHLADDGRVVRAMVAALENSGYFDIVAETKSAAEARRMFDDGSVTFVVNVPVNFTRDLMRGQRPQLLIEADATDPSSAANAIGTIAELARSALKDDLVGPLAARAPGPPLFETIVHRRYNPEGVTQYNIVPGLLGVILTMTMIMITSLAMTRERERGTFENLLAMPARPLEVMLGKIVPYVLVGYVQVALILLAAKFIFGVPMIGSFALLSWTLALFIAANLAVGFTFSTVAENQLQAIQMTFFFFLPSILLSGFMFPFRGMPIWAQWIGEVLPLTHFLRIVRGILLKGNGFVEIWPNVWPLLVFMFAAGTIAMLRYRRTLD